jgi:hypothetical protein
LIPAAGRALNHNFLLEGLQKIKLIGLATMRAIEKAASPAFPGAHGNHDAKNIKGLVHHKQRLRHPYGCGLMLAFRPGAARQDWTGPEGFLYCPAL